MVLGSPSPLGGQAESVVGVVATPPPVSITDVGLVPPPPVYLPGAVDEGAGEGGGGGGQNARLLHSALGAAEMIVADVSTGTPASKTVWGTVWPAAPAAESGAVVLACKPVASPSSTLRMEVSRLAKDDPRSTLPEAVGKLGGERVWVWGGGGGRGRNSP